MAAACFVQKECLFLDCQERMLIRETKRRKLVLSSWDIIEHLCMSYFIFRPLKMQAGWKIHGLLHFVIAKLLRSKSCLANKTIIRTFDPGKKSFFPPGKGLHTGINKRKNNFCQVWGSNPRTHTCTRA